MSPPFTNTVKISLLVFTAGSGVMFRVKTSSSPSGDSSYPVEDSSDTGGVS